jgi:hypothetical protein
MEVIIGRTIGQGPRHDGQVFQDLHLKNCTFESATLIPDWSDPDPRRRPTVRNVLLQDTRAYSGSLEGVILDDVTVENTRAGKGPLFLRGNAYRHVTLKGRIAPLEIRGKMFPPSLRPESAARISAAWDHANAEFYATVDWALDITQATYGSLSISGIPTRLIRRNPANTAVVTRERALEGAWRGLPWRRGLYDVVISWFLDDGYPDVLLIASPRSTRYDDDLADLQLLRNAGIAV